MTTMLPALMMACLVCACQNGKQKGGDSAEGITGFATTTDGGGTATADWSVDGNAMTYGSHTYTMQGDFDRDYVEGGKAKVTFTNVPSDYEEFQTVYREFLGKTSYGVSAMLPMAFEMWGRNHEVGEQCLQLISHGTCYNEIMRQLPAHMERSEFSPSDDPYVQRCLPAAVLQGASKENGYNPTEPYTVNMAIGLKDNWGEESEILQSYVYKLNIISGNAWATQQRGVTVQLPWRGEQLYKVNGCPALYVNIYPPRQDWNGLK